MREHVKKANIIYGGQKYKIRIVIIKGYYYAKFEFGEKPYQIKMYPVSRELSPYIEDCAKWAVYDYVSKYSLDAVMNHMAEATDS
ncbi:MAG: hypothetical protein LUE29_11300 [Lachnospiraceae bacterium]|nr:hypothetical protein [Lachnospiraceae bacterium]